MTMKNFNRIPQELCFTANTAGSTVKLAQNWSPTTVTLETSTDGSTRTTYTIGNTITLSNVGDKVYWRNASETDTAFSIGATKYYYFSMSWSISWSWDVCFLLNKNGTQTLSNYCFYNLFRQCSSLITPPKIWATTIALYSCWYMFNSCSNLTTPPLLPATSINRYCYMYMFNSCTSLSSLPELPATAVQQYSYYYMFTGCSKIKMSTSKTWKYQTPYRIPTTWTGTYWTGASTNMFNATWWTFTWTPSVNKTYYTSNTLV